MFHELRFRRPRFCPVLVVVVALSWSCKKDEAAGDGSSADGQAKTAGTEAGPQLPAAEELLAKAVKASGGKTRFDAIDSFYQEAQISIPKQKIAGETRVWWKNGDFYTEQQMVGVGLIQAGKTGDVLWSRDPIYGLRELDGQEAKQARWGASLSLIGEWQNYFDKARTTGSRIIDGKTIYDVTLTSEDGAKIVMGFDADSGLQVDQSFTNTNPMGEMPASVTFHDYRDVDGVLVSHRQIVDMSLAEMVQEITKIEFGVPIDESRFAMPRGGSEVVEVKDPAAESAPAKPTAMPFDADGKPGSPVPAPP